MPVFHDTLSLTSVLSSCFGMATDHQSKPIPPTPTKRATGRRALVSCHRYNQDFFLCKLLNLHLLQQAVLCVVELSHT